MDDENGTARRIVRWTNLILLLVAIVLAVLIGPFSPF